jgi:hypothetical protein
MGLVETPSFDEEPTMKCTAPSLPHPLLAAAATAFALAAAPASAQGLQLPPGCQALIPATCTYAPPVAWNTATVDRLLIDPARANHPIPVRIRYPVGANGPLPVVIWNHGGSTTNIINVVPPGIPVTFGQTQSERRSISFATADYIVIHIGRLLYGPQNVATVAGRLAALQATMPREFIGSFDREKIVVGGWSGGS